MTPDFDQLINRLGTALDANTEAHVVYKSVQTRAEQQSRYEQDEASTRRAADKRAADENKSRVEASIAVGGHSQQAHLRGVLGNAYNPSVLPAPQPANRPAGQGLSTAAQQAQEAFRQIIDADSQLRSLRARRARQRHFIFSGVAVALLVVVLLVVFLTAQENSRQAAATATYVAMVNATATSEAANATQGAILAVTATEVALRDAATATEAAIRTAATATQAAIEFATATESAARNAAFQAQFGQPMPLTNEDWTPTIRTFDGVEMVLVPPGCFTMGSDTHTENERPEHPQCVNAFWIDRYEVTNIQFAQFNGEAATSSYQRDEYYPRESITWFEARDFCENRRPNSVRLPTEAEWEYAARGLENWTYPWGDSFNRNAGFVGNSGQQSELIGRHPRGASWVGALDMSGNVWEWVNSIYTPYPYAPTDGRENAEDSDSPRVTRGGSWYFSSNNSLASDSLSAVVRYEENPASWHNDLGFRCAQAFSGLT